MMRRIRNITRSGMRIPSQQSTGHRPGSDGGNLSNHTAAAPLEKRRYFLTGFSLLELLVVISILTLLVALLIPVLRAAKERAHRIVCLSNLRQLTLAWILYAEENDNKIVCGKAFHIGKMTIGNTSCTEKGWVGRAFFLPKSRSDIIQNTDKGSLWPYVKNIDAYRCPRGRARNAVTYTPVVAANGVPVEGTYIPDSLSKDFTEISRRVGKTVLRLTRLSDIVSPIAAQRAVFMDMGQTPFGSDFYVHYLYPKWKWYSAPPIRHHDGVTLSMADGHAEYWKWKGRESITIPRELYFDGNLFLEVLKGDDYEPQTEDGLYDLQRLQKATWGRLGYSGKKAP